jgi:hypothetical protein
VWLAVALPATLGFAIFSGWSEVAWVLGVFLLLELVLVNLVEPWLYGRSAGLSAIAIIAAALFWTWLWGPVGLLLAIPLTVCVAVIGRYIPELGYLNVLLGVEPVLSPEARFYQRLIALDQEEATTLAEDYAKEHGTPALYEAILIPALSLAEIDRQQGALDAERERFVYDTTRQIIEEIPLKAAEKEEQQEQQEKQAQQAVFAHVCIIPAHDEADELAGAMLARLLRGARPFSSQSLAGETLEKLGENPCSVVCISAVPPRAASHAAYIARRLKQRFPELKILVALWAAENVERISSRLRGAGVDEVLTRLDDVVARLRQPA